MFSQSQNLGLLNQPKSKLNRQGYSIDLDQMNNQLKKIKARWSDYNKTIQTIQTDFLKIKENAAGLLEYARLNCEKVKENDSKEEKEERGVVNPLLSKTLDEDSKKRNLTEIFEDKQEPSGVFDPLLSKEPEDYSVKGNLSVITEGEQKPEIIDPLLPKQMEDDSVKDNSDGINKEKHEAKVMDPLLSEEIDEKQKLQTYARALEMISQKEKYFKCFKDSIKTKSKHFEDFHSIIQGKMKRMESMSSEIFEKCEAEEKMKIINEISLSDSELELHDKCCELYNEVVRDHNMLRVNYGLPEKSDQNDVDEIEKKADSCINLCKKLNLYSPEKQNTGS